MSTLNPFPAIGRQGRRLGEIGIGAGTGALSGAGAGSAISPGWGTAIGAVVGAGTGALAGNATYEQQLQAKKDQQSQEALAGQQQRDIEAKIAAARTAFGQGTGPASLANSQRLKDYQNQLWRSNYEGALGQAESQYSGGLSSTRQQLARAGLLGSGMEGMAIGNLQQQLLGGRMGAATGANQAQQQFQTGQSQQLAGLESAIRGGGTVSPEQLAGLQNNVSYMKNAASPTMAWQTAGGDISQQLASGYASGQMANAYGRRGWNNQQAGNVT